MSVRDSQRMDGEAKTYLQAPNPHQPTFPLLRSLRLLRTHLHDLHTLRLLRLPPKPPRHLPLLARRPRRPPLHTHLPLRVHSPDTPRVCQHHTIPLPHLARTLLLDRDLLPCAPPLPLDKTRTVLHLQ